MPTKKQYINRIIQGVNTQFPQDFQIVFDNLIDGCVREALQEYMKEDVIKPIVKSLLEESGFLQKIHEKMAITK